MAKRFYSEDRAVAQDEPGCCLSMVRYLTILLNMIFLLAFIAAIVAASLAKTGNFEEFDRNCSVCTDSWITVIVLFACLGVVSIIGLVALCCRIRWVVYLYVVIAVLQGLALFTVGSLLVVVHEGALDDVLKTQWVESSSENKCHSQIHSECSGWAELCGNVTSKILLNETVPEGCADCGWNDNNRIVSFTETCDGTLNHAIDQVFIPASVVVFVAGALCFLAAIIACKIRKAKGGSEDQSLLNEQYV